MLAFVDQSSQLIVSILTLALAIGCSTQTSQVVSQSDHDPNHRSDVDGAAIEPIEDAAVGDGKASRGDVGTSSDAVDLDGAVRRSDARSDLCSQGVPALCKVTFELPVTTPMAQSSVALSADYLDSPWPKSTAAGAIALNLTADKSKWVVTVTLEHGRVVQYKYIAAWPDNPGPVWVNQQGDSDDAPNSILAIDCNALACGVASGRSAMASATLKVHGPELLKSQGLVGLGAGLVVDGKVAAVGGFGYADQQNKVLVQADKTRFRWASVSKTIVGVVAAKLAAKGVLNLDADAFAEVDNVPNPTHWVKSCTDGTMQYNGQSISCSKGWFWLPLNAAQQKVSFRHLLGHLGGVAHYSNGLKDPSPPASEADDPKINQGPKWALSYLAEQPLIAIPGEKNKYTSFGFNLVGVALGQSQSLSFEALASQEFLGPNQLNTIVADRLWESIESRAVGYWKGNDGTILPQGSNDVSWKLPGGGYISTVVDMANYCRSLADVNAFGEKERALAWTSQKTNKGEKTGYGLGFNLGTRQGRSWVGHSGSQQKVRSNLRLYPDEGLCVVLASNSSWAGVSTLTNKLESVLRSSLNVAKGP